GIDLEARDRWFSQAIAVLRRCFCAPRAPARFIGLDCATRTAPVSTAARPTSSPCRSRCRKNCSGRSRGYDSGPRSQIQTNQDKAALRSLVELKDVATSGATDLHFVPTRPPAKRAGGSRPIPAMAGSSYRLKRPWKRSLVNAERLSDNS